MQSIKVAEIFAEMGINLDEKSAQRVSKRFEKLGKENAKNVSKPMMSKVKEVDSSIRFLSRSIKGFIAFRVAKAGFDMVANSIKGMNEELKTSIGFTSSIEDIGESLKLSFLEAQQLNLSGILAGMEGGASELEGAYKNFLSGLEELKKGEDNDKTNVLQSVLGKYLDKESNFELFGRLVSSNKYLDKETVAKNIEVIFGATNSKTKEYLSGAGADNLNEAYRKYSNKQEKYKYYVHPEQNKNLANASKEIILKNYEKTIEDINNQDVERNKTVALNEIKDKENIEKMTGFVGNIATGLSEWKTKALDFYANKSWLSSFFEKNPSKYTSKEENNE